MSTDNERHLTNLLDWRTKERDEARTELRSLEEQLESAREALREIAYDGPNPGLRRSEELQWASDVARRALASNPASDQVCPDCKGAGSSDTETGAPCQRPSSSCEECFTCDGTGRVPSPASEPQP